MLGDKFDGRLLTEIEASVGRGVEGGKSLAEVGEEELIPVTITHPEGLSARVYKDRERTLEGLTSKFEEKQEAVLGFLEGVGVTEVERLVLSNSIAARMQITQLQQLDEERDLDSDIELVRLVKEDDVQLLHMSAQVVNAPFVWDELRQDGSGVKVAVLDSGIEKDHSALQGKVIAEVSTVPSEDVDEPGDHGTHVGGIIASQNSYRRGIASGADLINVKVLTKGGSGDHTWVEKGMEEAYRLGADIVNMSLGWSHVYHNWQCDDGRCSLCKAAESLVDLGIVVVVAAGNENDAAANAVPPFDTSLRCPGQARRVITVGGIDNAKNIYSSSSVGPPSYYEGWSQTIHFPFSLRIPLPQPGEPWWTKPDVCAPGVNVYSTVTGDKWDSKTGTSMAAPHVSGIAALMLQRSPGLSPMEVKTVLRHTAESLKDRYGRFEVGDGVANAYGAVRHA